MYLLRDFRYPLEEEVSQKIVFGDRLQLPSSRGRIYMVLKTKFPVPVINID